MSHTAIKAWLVLLLSAGLVYTEINPGFSMEPSAQKLDPQEARSEMLLSFIDASTENTNFVPVNSDLIFLDGLDLLPSTLSTILDQSERTLSMNFAVASPDSKVGFGDLGSPEAIVVPPALTPPAGSPLDRALGRNGKTFYREDDKIVVIFPDQKTFQSFYVSTGLASEWLQLELKLDPVDSQGALETYQTHFKGKIVAETDEWALLKFPSGNFLKVAKAAPKKQVPFITIQGNAAP